MENNLNNIAKKVSDLFAQNPTRAAITAAKAVGLTQNATQDEVKNILETLKNGTKTTKVNGAILLTVAATMLEKNKVDMTYLCFQAKSASTLALDAVLGVTELKPEASKATLSNPTAQVAKNVVIAISSYNAFIGARAEGLQSKGLTSETKRSFELIRNSLQLASHVLQSEFGKDPTFQEILSSFSSKTFGRALTYLGLHAEGAMLERSVAVLPEACVPRIRQMGPFEIDTLCDVLVPTMEAASKIEHLLGNNALSEKITLSVRAFSDLVADMKSRKFSMRH